MKPLTTAQICELKAIRQTTAELKGPTFLWRGLYRDPVVGPLVRRRLITWGPWKDRRFDPRRFACVRLTAAGRAALRSLER